MSSRKVQELERQIRSLETQLQTCQSYKDYYEKDWKEQRAEIEELQAALDTPMVLPESLGISVGAIVLMVENRMENLPIKTGSDLDDYAAMEGFVEELRLFIEAVLIPSEGHTEDEALAQFWKESTELYEDLTD